MPKLNPEWFCSIGNVAGLLGDSFEEESSASDTTLVGSSPGRESGESQPNHAGMPTQETSGETPPQRVAPAQPGTGISLHPPLENPTS